MFTDVLVLLVTIVAGHPGSGKTIKRIENLMPVYVEKEEGCAFQHLRILGYVFSEVKELLMKSLR